VANRLDRNTSGLLLAGKTLQGQQNLSKALNDRSLKKIYHCVVKGALTEDVLLEGYLEKDEVTNTVSLSQEPKADAKPIKTFFHPLEVAKDTTLLEVQLFTGRTHQIRAHLSYLGHPILGDPKYGDLQWNQEMKKKYGVKSQLLHAYSLTFADGRRFVAPEPELFQRVMQ
jgi:23S rRNA pseudouridine955/2504/2580 synthase